MHLQILKIKTIYTASGEGSAYLVA